MTMVSLRILSITFCLSLTCRLSLCSPAPDAQKETIEAVFEALEKRLEETSDSGAVGEAVKRGAKKGAVMADKVLINAAEMADILKLHNDERSATNGNDEMAITWDDELAKLAQGLSDTCKFKHANMELPNGKRVGQNIAKSGDVNAPLGDLVQLWINEKKDYNLATGKCRPGKECGHYTAMVWHYTDKVGCGATKCHDGVFLTCDYLRAGNMRGKKAVNLGGAPCSQCNLSPGTACKNGLCSACQPGSPGCTAYDASTCVDNKQTCRFFKKYCSQPKYRTWLEGICAKTCGFCVS